MSYVSRNNFRLQQPVSSVHNSTQSYSNNIKLQQPKSFSQWNVTDNNNHYNMQSHENDRPKSINSHHSKNKPLKNSRLSNYIAQEAKQLIQQRQPYQWKCSSIQKHDRCRSLYDEHQYKTGTSHYSNNYKARQESPLRYENQETYEQQNRYQIPSFGLDARSSHSQSKNYLVKANSQSLFTTFQQKNRIHQYPVSHKIQPVASYNQNNGVQNAFKYSASQHINKNNQDKRQTNVKQNKIPYGYSGQKLRISRKSLPKQTLLTANLNISRKTNQNQRKYQLKQLDHQRLQNMNQINTKIKNILSALQQQSSHQEQFNRRYSPQRQQFLRGSPIHQHQHQRLSLFQKSWQNPFTSKLKIQEEDLSNRIQRQTLSSLIPNLCQTFNYQNSYQINDVNQSVNQFKLGSRYNNHQDSYIQDSRSMHKQEGLMHNQRYTFGLQSRYLQNKSQNHSLNPYQIYAYSDQIKESIIQNKGQQSKDPQFLRKSVDNIRKKRELQRSQQKDLKQEFINRKSVFQDIKKSYLYSKKQNTGQDQHSNKITPRKPFRKESEHYNNIDKRTSNNHRQVQSNFKRDYSIKSMDAPHASGNRLSYKNKIPQTSDYDQKSLIVKGRNVDDQIAKIQKKIQSFEQMKRQLNIQSRPVSCRSKSPKSRQCSPRILQNDKSISKNNQNKAPFNEPSRKVKTQLDQQFQKAKYNYSKQKQNYPNSFMKNKKEENQNKIFKQISSNQLQNNKKIQQNKLSKKIDVNDVCYQNKENSKQITKISKRQDLEKQQQKAKYVEYEQVSTPRLLRNLKSRQQNKLKKQKKFKSQFMNDLNSYDRFNDEQIKNRQTTERLDEVQTPTLSGSRQTLTNLLKKLQTQICLDQNLRNLKKWFNSISSNQKWNNLQNILLQKNIKLQGQDIKFIFTLTQEQNNPFYSTRGQHSTYDELVCSYLASQDNWKTIKNSLSFNEIKQIQQSGFCQKALDIDRKGYMCIQDLTRFLNLQMNQYYRNRDIILIWRRIHKNQQNFIYEYQRMNFESITKTILKV